MVASWAMLSNDPLSLWFVHIYLFLIGILQKCQTHKILNFLFCHFMIFHRCGDRKQTEHLNIRNTTMDVSEAFEDIYTSCTFFIWASLDNMKSSVIEKRLTPYEDSKYLNISTVKYSLCVMYFVC